MEDFFPLVSIIVVTYNSESTIVETLDSAISQSYENIEIIISDDCSKDNTVSVVKTWLKQNEKSVIGGIKLLESEKNQGVCRNFNKAINSSTGQYIKIIAGDDKLFANCCSDFVNYVKEHPTANFVTSYLKVYDGIFSEDNCVNKNSYRRRLPIFDKAANVQLKQMAYKLFVSAATMFFSRSLFDKVGGFDERYIYEDLPFYINILEHGERIYLLETVTVGYRIHQSTFNSDQKLFNYEFSRHTKKFRQERCYKYYGIRQKVAVGAYYCLLTFLEKAHLNRKTKVTQFLFHAITGTIWYLGK